jgi:hypothetical protein
MFIIFSFISIIRRAFWQMQTNPFASYPPIYVLNILHVLKVVDQDLIDATIQDIDTFAPPLPMQGNSLTESPKL